MALGASTPARKASEDATLSPWSRAARQRVRRPRRRQRQPLMDAFGRRVLRHDGRALQHAPRHQLARLGLGAHAVQDVLAAPLAIHCAASALISGVAISAKERIDASTCARLSWSGAST